MSEKLKVGDRVRMEAEGTVTMVSVYEAVRVIHVEFDGMNSTYRFHDAGIDMFQKITKPFPNHRGTVVKAFYVWMRTVAGWRADANYNATYSDEQFQAWLDENNDGEYEIIYEPSD